MYYPPVQGFLESIVSQNLNSPPSHHPFLQELRTFTGESLLNLANTLVVIDYLNFCFSISYTMGKPYTELEGGNSWKIEQALKASFSWGKIKVCESMGEVWTVKGTLQVSTSPVLDKVEVTCVFLPSWGTCLQLLNCEAMAWASPMAEGAGGAKMQPLTSICLKRAPVCIFT